MSSDVVYNAKEIVKALNQLEPGMKNAMVKEMRKVAAPAISAIKSGIPSVNPFMSSVRPISNTNGRLGWGVGRKTDEVKFAFNVHCWY